VLFLLPLYSSLCVAMGAAESVQDVEEVSSTDKVWNEVSDLLQQSSKQHISHYGFSLRLKKLWRVRESTQLQEYEAKAKKLGDPTRLFHGTSVGNAMNITKSGFKLPEKAGMFGRGIYFADCPLKSTRFAPDPATGSFQRIVEHGLSGFWVKKVGQIMLCDVYLGQSKTFRRACNKLNPTKDLKPSSLLEKMVGAVSGVQEYHSAYVPGGWFGAVNVSEYVVYKEHQCIPRYLIEFEYVR